MSPPYSVRPSRELGGLVQYSEARHDSYLRLEPGFSIPDRSGWAGLEPRASRMVPPCLRFFTMLISSPSGGITNQALDFSFFPAKMSLVLALASHRAAKKKPATVEGRVCESAVRVSGNHPPKASLGRKTEAWR